MQRNWQRERGSGSKAAAFPMGSEGPTAFSRLRRAASSLQMQSEETVLASYGPTKTAILTMLAYAAHLSRAAAPSIARPPCVAARRAPRSSPPPPPPVGWKGRISITRVWSAPSSGPPGISGGAHGASDAVRVLRRAPRLQVAQGVEWDAVVREGRPCQRGPAATCDLRRGRRRAARPSGTARRLAAGLWVQTVAWPRFETPLETPSGRRLRRPSCGAAAWGCGGPLRASRDAMGASGAPSSRGPAACSTC